MKILIIGNFAVNYRGQLLIKYLSEKNYNYRHLDRTKYIIKPKKTLVNKALIKLINYIFQLIYFFYEILNILRSDIIYILPMNNDNLFRLKLVKMLNKKLITDYYVSLYDTYVNDRQTVIPNSKKALKLSKLDHEAIINSKIVIFLNKIEKEYYLDLLRLGTRDNYVIIPLSIPERCKADLPFLYGKTTIPNICWWGTFLQLHGLENIIDAAAILKQQNYMARFYIFGVSNDKTNEYYKMIVSKGLKDYVVIRIDLNFSNGLIEFLRDHCDLALGQFGTNMKASNVLVNKIIDAASIQIPIITRSNPAVCEFFDEDSIYMCPPDPREIAKTIKRALKPENKERLSSIVLAAHKIYDKHFSPKCFFKNLDILFNMLTC